MQIPILVIIIDIPAVCGIKPVDGAIICCLLMAIIFYAAKLERIFLFNNEKP